MLELTCPSCGSLIHLKIRSPHMITCNYCSSTSILEGESWKDIGKLAILTETPSIFTLDHLYSHKGWDFTPRGRVRYTYDKGRGFWDEWYVISSNGKASWISVDEGDIAVEVSEPLPSTPLPAFENLKVGMKILMNRKNFMVAELGTCTMIGCEGMLPFVIEENDTYNYADLLGTRKEMYTIEYEEDGIKLFKGHWIDPYEIKDFAKKY
ncbi:MAG: DUF4178 domain-containing protein [Candidatus Riflebacteria bacterium]|nr:DUF4178 domain-containing protein [Candidatus Riflebacteria bacterium]